MQMAETKTNLKAQKKKKFQEYQQLDKQLLERRSFKSGEIRYFS